MQVIDDTSVSGVQRGAEKNQWVLVHATSALSTFILCFSTQWNKRTSSAVCRENGGELEKSRNRFRALVAGGPKSRVIVREDVDEENRISAASYEKRI